MAKIYDTISDYHLRDAAVRADAAEWPHLRITALSEGSGDVTFVRTVRNGLVLTLDGSAMHLTQMEGINDASPSQPGDVCLIAAGAELRLAWQNHAPLQRSLMVEFDNALFGVYAPEIANEAFLRGHLKPANFSERPAIAQLMQVIAREADPALARGRLFAESAIRLLAIELAANAWTTPATASVPKHRPDARLQRALAYIETYFATDLSILDIAAAAGLSPTQLTRAFRATTGQTPYSYVIDRRLTHARHLLRTTDLPIAYIALDSGFADQAHLTRLFRARLGTTPRQVRLG